MSNNLKKSRFVYPFGSKKQGANSFNLDMDTTDQRAPVTTPQDALEQFFRPDEEVMDELENEKISDFDDDIYDYEDRGELGEDIALSQDPEITKLAPRLKKQPKKR